MATQYVIFPPVGSSSSSGGGGVTGSSLGVPYVVGPLDGAAASVNGGTIGSNSLYFQTFTSTVPGLTSSAAQTFGGVKTFA